MKLSISNLVKFMLSIALGILLVWYFQRQLTDGDRATIFQALKSANYFWILMIPLGGLISNFNRTQRWRLMLQSIGYNPGFWNTFFSVMIMYFANLFIPRLGEVSRCTILAKYENVPVEKSIGTMVVERLIDLACVIIIAVILFFLERQRLYDLFAGIFNKEASEPSGNPFIKNIVLIVLFLAIVIGSVYIIRKHGIQKLQEVTRQKVVGLWEGLKSIKDLKRPWEFLFHTLCMWFCYFIMGFLAFNGLQETTGLSVSAGMACLVFGGLAMVATPGGIGAFPLAVQAVLLQYNIAAPIGGAFGWLMWGMQTITALTGGIISLIVLALMNKSDSKDILTKTE